VFLFLFCLLSASLIPATRICYLEAETGIQTESYFHEVTSKSAKLCQDIGCVLFQDLTNLDRSRSI